MCQVSLGELVFSGQCVHEREKTSILWKFTMKSKEKQVLESQNPALTALTRVPLIIRSNPQYLRIQLCLETGPLNRDRTNESIWLGPNPTCLVSNIRKRNLDTQGHTRECAHKKERTCETQGESSHLKAK